MVVGSALVLLVAAAVLVGSLSSDGSFEDVAAVFAALDESGVECTQQTAFDTADQGLSSGRCYLDGGEYEVDIYVFEDAETRDLWLENLKRVWDQEILVGPNWFVTTGSLRHTKEVRAALDGEIVPP